MFCWVIFGLPCIIKFADFRARMVYQWNIVWVYLPRRLFPSGWIGLYYSLPLIKSSKIKLPSLFSTFMIPQKFRVIPRMLHRIVSRYRIRFLYFDRLRLAIFIEVCFQRRHSSFRFLCFRCPWSLRARCILDGRSQMPLFILCSSCSWAISLFHFMFLPLLNILFDWSMAELVWTLRDVNINWFYMLVLLLKIGETLFDIVMSLVFHLLLFCILQGDLFMVFGL